MDKRGMEQVYADNANCVYRYLLCLTHSADMAEELTQETFYQATKGIGRFRGECKISVWLCQIAKRLWYREQERKKKHAGSLEDIPAEPSSGQDVEGDCLHHMDAVALYKSLHTFDEQTREVMYLRLTGFLSFREIGDILGESETWARVTFYRGKQKLLKGRKL